MYTYIYIYYITLHMTDTYFTFNLGSGRDESRQDALVIFEKFPTKQQFRDAFAVNSPDFFFIAVIDYAVLSIGVSSYYTHAVLNFCYVCRHTTQV